MIFTAKNRVTRPLILALLSGMMALALYYSLSINAGHADAPIAPTAAETEALAAGMGAPTFQVRTVDGDAFRFAPSALDKPVLLITFRGGWCPYCNMHLSELRRVIPEIRELGVDVLFLSGDRPDQVYQSLEQDTQQAMAGPDYTILSDADANAAIALGIAFRASDQTINRRHERGQDIDGSSMSKHKVLPVPAVFAIGTDGVIAFAYANPDYKIRVPADELLRVAKNLVNP